MLIGERCIVNIQNAPEITTEGPVTIEIETIRFGSLRRNRWELPCDKREKLADNLKLEGNELIKKENYEEAKAKYEEAYNLIKNDFYDELK